MGTSLVRTCVAQRWLGLRLEVLGACIMFCVSSITWAGRGYLTNSVVGLVLIWAMVRTPVLLGLSLLRRCSVVDVVNVVDVVAFPVAGGAAVAAMSLM